MRLIAAGVAALALSVAACGDDNDDGTQARETTTTTTEAELPERETVTFDGAGSFTSEPVELSGSYHVTYDFSGCPVAGADLFPLDESLLEMHSAGDATGTGETNIHNITAGVWYLEVYSCPEPWTVTLTPTN
jgi:hypothetical protein